MKGIQGFKQATEIYSIASCSTRDSSPHDFIIDNFDAAWPTKSQLLEEIGTLKAVRSFFQNHLGWIDQLISLAPDNNLLFC